MSDTTGVNLDRQLTGYRFAAIQVDDTMQLIALRELGDASKWVDLVNINGLLPPYITADSTATSDTLKTYGDLIIVPAAQQQSKADPSADDTYFTDAALVGGRLVIGDGGDLATVTGLSNLEQALTNALSTDKQDLLFHPAYGTRLRRVVGNKNNPAAEHLAGGYVKATLLADVRVQKVLSVKVQLTLDKIFIAAKVQPISGSPVAIAVEY